MQSGYTSAPVFGVSYDDKDKEFTLDDLFNDLMQSDLQDIDTFQSYGSIECESNGEMKTKETKPTSTSNSTDSDKMERRERNREHAKRSRIRKKICSGITSKECIVITGRKRETERGHSNSFRGRVSAISIKW
mmetsp:Transcript_8695/g.12976  ORF Transcript_8695/g.12976 Transcript_8695/m.12976 type:complete len:133 (+) Transcript_8695:160-558(+)